MKTLFGSVQDLLLLQANCNWSINCNGSRPFLHGKNVPHVVLLQSRRPRHLLTWLQSLARPGIHTAPARRHRRRCWLASASGYPLWFAAPNQFYRTGPTGYSTLPWCVVSPDPLTLYHIVAMNFADSTSWRGTRTNVTSQPAAPQPPMSQGGGSSSRPFRPML